MREKESMKTKERRRDRIGKTQLILLNKENSLEIQSKICKDLQNKFVDDLKCKLVESKIQFVREKESRKTKENSCFLSLTSSFEPTLPSALICIAFYSCRKLREPLLFVKVT